MIQSRSDPQRGNVVRKTSNDAVCIPELQDWSCESRPKSQLEEETAQALRLYRARLREAEAAEAALRGAVEEEQTLARDLDAPRVSHLAEYRDALHQLATVYSVHNAAQRRLDAAREHYIVLETQLGFIPEL